MSNVTFPERLLYSADHEWMDAFGIEAKIGITSFAADALGDIVYLDIPVTGKRLEKGEVFGTVEAVKTVSDLFMPVSGVVIRVNPKVVHAPELVNADPYGEGWLVEINLTAPEERQELLTAADYTKLL